MAVGAESQAAPCPRCPNRGAGLCFHHRLRGRRFVVTHFVRHTGWNLYRDDYSEFGQRESQHASHGSCTVTEVRQARPPQAKRVGISTRVGSMPDAARRGCSAQGEGAFAVRIYQPPIHWTLLRRVLKLRASDPQTVGTEVSAWELHSSNFASSSLRRRRYTPQRAKPGNSTFDHHSVTG